MPIRFQADADLTQIIVSAVARRYPEMDIRTASRMSEQIARCTARRRPGPVLTELFVSHDDPLLNRSRWALAASVSPWTGASDEGA
jgi:hypothetical protein